MNFENVIKPFINHLRIQIILGMCISGTYQTEQFTVVATLIFLLNVLRFFHSLLADVE